LTCAAADKCTKCKGNFTKVTATGTCECIEGTSKNEGEVNCKIIAKPNIVIPGEKGEEEEEDEQCIVIKKVIKEGSSGWTGFV